MWHKPRKLPLLLKKYRQGEKGKKIKQQATLKTNLSRMNGSLFSRAGFAFIFAVLAMVVI